MDCHFCNEKSVPYNHELSEKHIKNKTLHQYQLNKSRFTANRNGIWIGCSVETSNDKLKDVTGPTVKVRVPPKEKVTFEFSIVNKSNRTLSCVNTKFGHVHFNFNKEDYKPTHLKKDYRLQEDITFESEDCGKFSVPVMFYIKESDESIDFIIRELIVIVSDTAESDDEDYIVFNEDDIVADELVPSNVSRPSNELFRIPQNLRKPFCMNLIKSKKCPANVKDSIDFLLNIFVKGVTPENYISFFKHLLWYDETIVQVNLKKYNMSKVILIRNDDGYEFEVPGLESNRPSLCVGDHVLIKPENKRKSIMFEGIICSINEITVSIDGLDPSFHAYYSPTTNFQIRFLLSRITFERMHFALSHAQSQMDRLFPKEKIIANNINSNLEYYNPNLNKDQKLAVDLIIAGNYGTAPFIVHGPPGTGKTTTIVEAIIQLMMKSYNNRILICTESNSCADHLASMLIKYAYLKPNESFLLRVNSAFRKWDTFLPCLDKYSNGYNKRTWKLVPLENLVKYRILITTLSTAGRYAKDLKEKGLMFSVTHLFIDDASQASEPASLIPICGLLNSKGSLILSGDNKQLGPVIKSNNAGKIGLEMSLMERLEKDHPMYRQELDSSPYMVMLKENYRSDPVLIEIPNKLFYNDKLRPKAPFDSLSKMDILGDKKTSDALIFHGLLSAELKKRKTPSFYNTIEVDIVKKYVTRLVEVLKINPLEIGIVTPYARQVAAIKDLLGDLARNYSDIEVGTVESFQGKEKRVIIISTVRGKTDLLKTVDKNHLGFLDEPKRFNVSITRAKAKLIVIGNPIVLNLSVYWKTLINKSKELGTYCGFDSTDSENAYMQIMPDLENMVINE